MQRQANIHHIASVPQLLREFGLPAPLHPLIALVVSQKNPELYRKLDPVDLTNKRILNLAKGLAPAYVRVSGTWANATYFQDNDEPIQPAPEGFLNVLTRSQWKGVLDFLNATNSELVTSFAVSNKSIGRVTPDERFYLAIKNVS